MKKGDTVRVVQSKVASVCTYDSGVAVPQGTVGWVLSGEPYDAAEIIEPDGKEHLKLDVFFPLHGKAELCSVCSLSNIEVLRCEKP